MSLSPDETLFWQYGIVHLNATILYTWGLMLMLTLGAWLITRRLSSGLTRSRWQNLLEIIVTTIMKQIEEVGLTHPQTYLGFLGTLFLFVASASLLTIVPGYQPPTGSLSTTVALALCVFVAVPLFGIAEQGWVNYLKSYVQPTFHAAVQPHQRTVTHSGAGRPPVWQHDERRHDHRHSAQHYPFHLSDCHDPARSAHRHGTGVHFQHFGSGLHCRCDASP